MYVVDVLYDVQVVGEYWCDGDIGGVGGGGDVVEGVVG